MLGLVTTARLRDSTRIEEVPEPTGQGVLLRTVEVGVCGTDREIAEGIFGVAPAGAKDLILGHEFLGRVEQDGFGFSAGELVTATVRRSCGRCFACGEGSPDACDSGDYIERGITALDGFARELLIEDPAQLIRVPGSLGRLGVLAEPASVSARAIRHAQAIGRRQPWTPTRALVLGAGAIGMLATYMLRLAGHDVWTVSRSAPESLKGRLVAASGAQYVSSAQLPIAELRDHLGGFDLVIESMGDAQIMLSVLALLRRNGVGCLLGLDARSQQLTLPGQVVGIDAVLENRVLFGSVNAHLDDWRTAVARLDEMQQRWPEALEAIVGLRVPPERFSEAFAYSGVKATLCFNN